MSVNEEKLQSFVMEKVLPETAAAMSVVIAIIGDKLGLFKGMDGAGPLSPAALAEKTGTTERYVREWLSAMAAAGWIDYHAGDETFELTPEQAMVFANDDSPYNLQGAFQIIGSTFRDHNLNVEAFRTGEGIAWGDHSQCLFGAVERFFRVKYVNQLVSKWLPALDGVVGKLEAGAKFADVGCGHAVTTLVMGRAFPNSEFVGYDFHGPSIERARELAAGEGLANLSFEVATAKDYPGRDFDIVAFFDCLHDMGDPVGACQHAKSTLRPDGTLMGGRALRQGPARGQLHADRPDGVRRLDLHLHAGVAEPGSRPRPRRPGRPGPHAKGHRRGRVLELPGRLRDRQQPGARGAALERIV
jgi:SAM-dependent methyltransferase